MIGLIIVSLLTRPTSEEQLRKTTIYGDLFAEPETKVPLYANYRLWLGIATSSAAGLWIYFS